MSVNVSHSSNSNAVQISRSGLDASVHVDDQQYVRPVASDYSTTESARMPSPEFSHSATVTGSARTEWGSAVGRAEMTPQTLVQVEGQTMTARTAERLGYIVRDGAGLYSDALASGNVSGSEMQSDSAGDDTAPAVESIGEEVEGLLASLAAGTAQTDLVGALRELTTNGEMSAATVERIASQMQLDPAAISGQVETIRAGFERQASKAVEGAGGLSAETIFEMAREHAPEVLRKAATQQAMDGSMSGYSAVVGAVVDRMVAEASAGRSKLIVDAAPGSGMRIERSGHDYVVHFDVGHSMELRAAIRAGMVTA